ncbi:MAG: GH1 family beta-glucosidase [Bradyrhizobium sp.]|jgi:beta-glucosidase|uniref:Beta-glucosidase n=3 Tax=Pseudomonadota TaxID=1224 RepID=A0ABS5GCU0_9BRAD|nr:MULTISPECIES: GH1 family beta-glucosidase [Bradyrhizobium]MBR1138804.1 beta-glucosidase [Bradyrhizobium denitrificans]MDU0954186.1 GH1 family beta-glucosidase [Bradyrhizobium sp.]MDU1493165.1 GH1 family beta-glucosidase [Bradyrhizobium sp.]MDU1543519.1 GH1 family beta-glucosidase [Bradyrhizobium sp.]MDU1665403.1 GH1 family beta-glucosidase [Bradyrhizobium sp.]
MTTRPRFVWGASTSAFQIEGAAHRDGRADSIWDVYLRAPGRVSHNDTADIACDHYHRYADDVTLMRDLGLDAYRFSIAWPRVLPQGRGAANEAGLAFYDRLIDALLAAGIEPWLCLYHWDLPQALGELGGWQNRDIAGWFADYTALVARRYGDRVKRFATFNEPGVFTLFGYGLGWHAPGVADKAALHQAIHHVNLSHGRAVDVLRRDVVGASIGAIHNRQPCYPCTSSPEDAAAALRLAAYWNDAFPFPQAFACYPPALRDAVTPYVRPDDMAQIGRPVDWFGLNHYSPHYVKADTNLIGASFGPPPQAVPRSAIGWPVVPDAFRETLVDIDQRFRIPIYVMENGTAAADVIDPAGDIQDDDRIRYLKAYITAMEQAIAAGADVRGYFVWSLMDNFEWGAGYSQRFGIVYVDHATQRRIPKASARWYAEMIAARRSPDDPAGPHNRAEE